MKRIYRLVNDPLDEYMEVHMVCNSCKKEFNNVNALNFCPYCGAKTGGPIDVEFEEITDETDDQQDAPIEEESRDEEEKFDTLKMPRITPKDIMRYNRHRFFTSLRKNLLQRKVVIPIVTAFLFIAVGVVGYKFLMAKPVDEGRIKEDLIGKIVTLPKGTNIEIKKGYIKSLSVNSRATDKNNSQDTIKVSVTLNNGSVEVKTMLSMLYVNAGKNQWDLKGKIGLVGDAVVKPVAAMDEKQFLDQLKKQNVTIGDVTQALNGGTIKSLAISKRTLDLKNEKEEILVDLGIDSGLVTAKGTIKCELSFGNEVWGIATVDRNSTDDFVLALSPSFSDDKALESIKAAGLDETVTSPDLFSGKGFNLKDSFTKNITVAAKKFDEQTGKLAVTAKRENTAGEIKSTLQTDYSFQLSLSKMTLINKSKTTVTSATVANMANDLIISTITSVAIEGANFLFWFPDNHVITSDEAKTFKLDEILSQKGLQNVKYVYGSITYMDANKPKTSSVVAIYSLAYDASKGYTWKIDKIVGEDSPNYKTYSKASINQ